MKELKPKKKLGQHFLKDSNIAKKIVDALNHDDLKSIIEIGPGMGVLTDHLIPFKKKLKLVEIDFESVKYLNKKYIDLNENIIEKDFLKINLKEFDSPIGMIGNFPYNISSQILFKMLENKSIVDQLVGMFQLEVAKRVCAPPGSKIYGILSVLVQAFYNTEFLFSLSPDYFSPPPKVNSGVIKLIKKKKLI